MNHILKLILTVITGLFVGALITAGFSLVDGVILYLLPRLNISYGRFVSGFAALIAVRLLILFLWGVAMSLLAVVQPRPVVRIASLLLVGMHVLLLGALVYGFCIEPFRLTVTRFTTSVPGLEKPVRIVQLTDIHVERTTRRELAIPGLVDSLQPDMILITGDFPNESYIDDTVMRRDLRDLIGQLHAPLGVYGVNGNVDSVADDRYLMEGLNIRLLDNEILRVPQLGDHFAILGLSYVYHQHDREKLKELVKQTQPGDYTLLLYHKPDLAYAASELGVDLYLAGHTHGGQVRLPLYGAIVTNSMYGKRFEMGPYEVGEMSLFVSRGLGFTGGSAPRIRFLAPPEVAVIDLVPAVQ